MQALSQAVCFRGQADHGVELGELGVGKPECAGGGGVGADAAVAVLRHGDSDVDELFGQNVQFAVLGEGVFHL